MIKKFTYTPHGTCSSKIHISVDDSRIANVAFTGGCTGNGLGLGALLKGMSVADAVRRLKGIDCDGRGTSCPDQLAKALEEMSAA
jgi:uncharacterized protein (TIGR03905 family)